MTAQERDVWAVMATARTIRRFTDDPVGRHGPVRRRPLAEVVRLDGWDGPGDALLHAAPSAS